MVRSPESTGRVGRFVLALVMAALGLALLAGPASAHTSLVASSPASGERVAYSPDEIVLTFATAVDPRTVTAELRSADGEVVAVEPLSGETGDTTVVAFAVPRLPHAVYGLAWQSVGDDGHRVLGEVLFGVGTEVGGTTSVAGGATPMARALDSAGLALRIAWYVVLALLAGVAVVGRAGVAGDVARRRIGGLLLLGGVVALGRGGVALAILLEAGAGDLAWTSRGTVGFAAVGVLLGLLAVAASRRTAGPEARPTPTPALVALLVAVIGGTLAGHALSREDPVLAVTFGILHLGAAAAWTGPLLVVLLVARTPAWRGLDAEERTAQLRASLRRMVPVAGWSLAVVGATGLLLAARAWSGIQGGVLAVLVVKALVVLAVAVPLGIWHHRTREGWVDVPRTARVEALGLVVALVLGAVLVGWDPGWSQGTGGLDPAVAAVLDGTADDPTVCMDLEVGRAACYRSTLSTVLATQGPQAAIDAAVAAQAVDSYVAENCHQVVHDIGNDAAEQIDDMADALSVDGSACWSGYFHGFIEARLAEIDDDALSDRLPTFCDGAADPQYSFTHYNCLHGLGHGLMLRVDADLFEALPLCRDLEEFWLVRSCASGAFMENVMAAQQGLQTPGVPTDDLRYPCTDVDADLSEDCWMMQTSMIIWRLGGDLPGAFEWCDSVDGLDRTACYRSMGRDISSIAALDPDGVIQRCSMGSADAAHWCIDGAASNAVYETSARESADALCAAVQEDWTAACEASRDQALSTVALG